MSTVSTPRFATVRRAATEFGVSTDTIRTWIAKGHFPVYKLPGQRSACVDLNEAQAALDRLGLVRQSYGSFGPDAVVRDLSKVAQDFEVLA